MKWTDSGIKNMCTLLHSIIDINYICRSIIHRLSTAGLLPNGSKNRQPIPPAQPSDMLSFYDLLPPLTPTSPAKDFSWQESFDMRPPNNFQLNHRSSNHSNVSYHSSHQSLNSQTR